MKLVSVVIPVFNGEKYLEECIKSVLWQSYKNIDVFIVNDASTDRTECIANELAANYENIHVLTLQDNVGPGAARNIGIEKSTGELVAFIDSDDVWHPDKISKQVALLSTHAGDCEVCYCQIGRVDEGGMEIFYGKSIGPTGSVLDRLIKENITHCGSTILATKESLNSVGGFDESREIIGSEDWDIAIRLSVVTEFLCVQEKSTAYRKRAEGLHSNTINMMHAKRYVRRKNCLLFGAAVEARENSIDNIVYALGSPSGGVRISMRKRANILIYNIKKRPFVFLEALMIRCRNYFLIPFRVKVLFENQFVKRNLIQEWKALDRCSASETVQCGTCHEK